MEWLYIVPNVAHFHFAILQNESACATFGVVYALCYVKTFGLLMCTTD